MDLLTFRELGRGGNGVVVEIMPPPNKKKKIVIDAIDDYSLDKIKHNCVFKVTKRFSAYRESTMKDYSLPKTSAFLFSSLVPENTIIHHFLSKIYKSLFCGEKLVTLVMEKRQMNLKQYLDQLCIDNMLLPQEKVEEILFDIVIGLALLHDNGIAHMDLSLENIMLNVQRQKDGTIFYAYADKVCIIDFGQRLPIRKKGGQLIVDHVSNITCRAPEQHDLPAIILPAYQDIWSIGLITLCLYNRSKASKYSDICPLDLNSIIHLNKSLFGSGVLVDKIHSYIPYNNNLESMNILLSIAKKCLSLRSDDRCSAGEIALLLYTMKTRPLDAFIYSMILDGFNIILNKGESMKVYDFVQKFIISKVRLCKNVNELEILTRGKFANKAYRYNMLCTITPSSVMPYVKKERVKNLSNSQNKSVCRARKLFNQKGNEYISKLPFINQTYVHSAVSAKSRFNLFTYINVMEPIIISLYQKIRNLRFKVCGMLSSDNPRYCMIGSVPSAICSFTKEFIDIDCPINFILDKNSLESIKNERGKDTINAVLKYLSSIQDPKKRIFQEFKAKRLPPMSCKYLTTSSLDIGNNAVASGGENKQTNNLLVFQDDYLSLNRRFSKLSLYEVIYEEVFSGHDCLTNLLSFMDTNPELLIEAFIRCILEKMELNLSETVNDVFNQVWDKYEMDVQCYDVCKEEFQALVVNSINQQRCTPCMSSALLDFMHSIKDIDINSKMYMHVEKRSSLGFDTGSVIVNPNSKHALKNIIQASGLGEMWLCDPGIIVGHNITVLGLWFNQITEIVKPIPLFHKDNAGYICDLNSNFPLPKFIIDNTVHVSKSIIDIALTSISDTYCKDLMNYMEKDLKIHSIENLSI